LPKARLDELKDTATIPVPESDTVEGLPAALWPIARLPEALPLPVGRNVTVIVQLALAAREVPQFDDWLNGEAVVIEEKISGASPVFETVTV
jgi:hypothetical protein